NHDRINDQRHAPVLPEKIHDRADDRLRKKHPGLHRRWLQLAENGCKLLPHDLRRACFDSEYAFRVLRRDACDRARPMYPERREGFQVGLNSGAAAAVRTGNGESDGKLSAFRHEGSIETTKDTKHTK